MYNKIVVKVIGSLQVKYEIVPFLEIHPTSNMRLYPFYKFI